MDEGTCLENRHTLSAYRGFESRPLRHFHVQEIDMVDWTIQDAQNRFRAVVDAALDGEPQRVTRHGKPAVIVLAVEDYQRLCQAEKADAPNFIEHLLAIPKATDDDTFELPPRTRDLRLRDIDF